MEVLRRVKGANVSILQQWTRRGADSVSFSWFRWWTTASQTGRISSLSRSTRTLFGTFSTTRTFARYSRTSSHRHTTLFKHARIDEPLLMGFR